VGKNQAEAIREAIAAGPNWKEYLRLVEHHHGPALSWAAFGRVPGIVLPEPERQELQKRNDV
jgi:hypothetical protein